MTPNVNGVNAVLDRISAVQSRFGSAGANGRRLGTADSATFDATLAQLSGSDDSDDLTSSVLSTQMFRSLTTTPTTTAAATVTAPSSVDGGDVVDAAKKYLGIPYVWGGSDPATGLDCSGLVQRAYADLGVSMPRVSGDQAKVGTAVASLADARPGDLVAFGQPVNHIGIYAGDGQMVVAPRRGDVVKVQAITAQPVAIRRVLPDTNAGTEISSSGAGANIATLLAVSPDTTVAELLASVLRNGGTIDLTGTTAVATPAAVSALDDSTPYADLFRAAGAKYGIDPEILAAVARAESGMNPAARSPVGAQGLMQIMPATAAELGVDPMRPAEAVDGAARLLSSHLDRFGSLDLALAAYNAGAGAVSRYNGIPPYSETQAYVRKILADLGDDPIARFASPSTSPTSPTATASVATTSVTTAVVTATPAPAASSTPVVTATTTAPAVASTAVTPAVTSAVVTGPVVPRPDPSSPVAKPTATSWGPNTQRQVTSQGGTNGTTWEALGYLKPAEPAAVTGVVAKAKGPVALGVLRLLQNATPAQLASKEYRQTLNDVNRDSLGDPTAPDVIEVDPSKDPAPVTNPNPNTGAAATPAVAAATQATAPASTTAPAVADAGVVKMLPSAATTVTA